MLQAIRQQVIIQPGGRIEIHSPELKPGQQAEVIVMIKGPIDKQLLLSSLIGKGKGAFNSPEEADEFLRKERDAWES